MFVKPTRYDPSPEEVEQEEKLAEIHGELWNVVQKYINPTEALTGASSDGEPSFHSFKGEPDDMVVELTRYVASKLGVL